MIKKPKTEKSALACNEVNKWCVVVEKATDKNRIFLLKPWLFDLQKTYLVCLRGRMGKVARLWLSFTMSQRARVRFPRRARSTKPSIPPGSVNWYQLVKSG
jgi:hypothetical protein